MTSQTFEMKKGAVALLDRLGTKGIWTRSDPAKVVASWQAVVQFFSEAVTQQETSGGEWGSMGSPRPHVIAFSDTIVLTVEGDDPARFLPLMFNLIGVPFARAMIQEVFLRGVFSIGTFYQTETLVIGPAVDEAAEWYEQPDWMGVSAAPSAAFGIERLREQGADVSPWFTQYDIPLKAGVYKAGWALAWPKLMTDTPLPNRVLTNRGLLFEVFSRNPVGVAALPKYRNTITFIDHVLRLHGQPNDPPNAR